MAPRYPRRLIFFVARPSRFTLGGNPRRELDGGENPTAPLPPAASPLSTNSLQSQRFSSFSAAPPLVCHLHFARPQQNHESIAATLSGGPHVRMKSYFANSFRVAMEQARKELGPYAMLVTTRTSALEARHLGEYEVVFAADLQPTENAAPP